MTVQNKNKERNEMQQSNLLTDLSKTMGEVLTHPTDEVSRQAAKSILDRCEQVHGVLSVSEGASVVHNPHTEETHVTVRLTIPTVEVETWAQ